MCTVTFLPGQGNHFILTSSRDEHALRKKAAPPRKFHINRQTVFYPKDAQAGGTWIATGVNNFTLCIMNGAFQRHTPSPPYVKSRGIMLLDFFGFNDVEVFAREYDFKGIEPFTLLLLNSSETLILHELRWDGQQVVLQLKDATQPQVWSSATLYDGETIDKRQLWFNEWLGKNELSDMESIFHFHEFGGAGDKATAVLMNRNNTLMTVSITSIQKSIEGIRMKYKDVLDDKNYTIRIL